MKKKLLFSAFLLAITTLLPLQSQAYDFSAVAPSGQTLYYRILSGNAQLCNETGEEVSDYDHFWDTPPSYNTTYPSGNLEIPSTVIYNGNTYSVTSIGGSAFKYCRGLTSVTIPNTITSIDKFAFSFCDSLTSITIPNSVRSIRSYAFLKCSGLTSITIPNSVITIGDHAFYHCSGLISVSIPDSVTSIAYGAFSCCSSLTNVSIPNSVTTIGQEAFQSCSRLTDVNIPNSVISIGTEAFCRCGLISINIPNTITTIGIRTFKECQRLISVTIPNTVTSIGSGAFCYCDSLTSVTIPNSVTSIGNEAFYGCGLTSITIPNSVTSIGAGAFGLCAFTSVTIPNSVTSIGNYAFYGCTEITEIICKCDVPPTIDGSNAFDYIPAHTPVYIPCGRTPYYAAADGWSRFTNFIEDSDAEFTAVSADEAMGTVQILSRPTCTSQQAVIYASANSGYRFDHWSDNSTSNPYTLTVSEDTELIGYFTPDGANPPVSNAPAIACVGLDQSGHNVVRWERNPASNAIRYNIYREGLGGYSQVGYVLSTGATEYSWVDDNSNTATQAYSYKLSELDANGTESDLSQQHKTIHLQISQGQGSTWNLSWTPYIGFDYSGYRIYRGTSATSMSLLTELSSSATTYSDNNAPSGDVYYQIEVAASNGAKSIVASSRSNIATSVQNQQFTLTVLSGNTSMGSVSGGGTFAQGATTTISATPLSGYTFTQWSDGSTQPQRTITVMGDATYTAYFTTGGSQPQQYLITVNSIDETMGTVTGGGLFDEGTVTTIMATAKPGHLFVQWHDGNTDDIRTITVTADATYTAFFRATGSEGIDDVTSTDNLKIYTRGNRIVIETTDALTQSSNNAIIVYDVMGRIIHTNPSTQSPTNTIEIPVPTTGLYMVKVADQPSRKVLVR